MDVRCEKCKTEYELEDNRVTGKGVTVKCTQCGHLFRVRKKTITGVVPPPEAGLNAPDKKPAEKNAVSLPVKDDSGKAAAKEAEKAAGTPPPEAKRWLIKRTSGEIFQFKELTTLQQWIVEEKVDREDEISKSGRAWEKLGAIEELRSFFSVVDQARQARRAKAKSLRESSRNEIIPKAEDPDKAKVKEQDFALAPTVPPEVVERESSQALKEGENEDDAGDDIPTAEIKAREDSDAYEMGSGIYRGGKAGPSEMGEKMGSGVQKNGRTAAWEKEGIRVPKELEPTGRITFEESEALKRPGSGALKVAAVIIIGVMVGLVGVVGIWKWDKIVDLLAGEEDTSTDRYSHARALLLEDTEESLNSAEELFRTVYGARKSAHARAGQAEVAAMQALYLEWEADALDRNADYLDDETAREIARIVEESAKEGKTDRKPVSPAGGVSTNPEAGELRRNAAETRAMAAIKAKRALEYAQEAYEAEKTYLTNRVMALALLAAKRSDGEVEKHLQAALDEKGNDPETLFVKGVHQFSQENLHKARQSLKQAIAIHRKESTKILYRAHYALALVTAEMKETEEARTELQTILAANKGHERAKRLLKRIKEAQKRPEPETIETVETKPDPDSEKPGEKEEEKPETKETDGEPSGPKPLVGDYDSLVRQGDRFSEIGRVDDAVRAYNQALEQRSSGVEALTGLAYCYLDRGNTSQARTVFQRALSRSPSHGEALIGMAEIYKKQMNWNRALEYFRRYLNHHPGGRRSGLAHRNIRELEDRVKQDRPGDSDPPPDEDPDDGETSTKGPGTIIVPPPKEKQPDAKPETKQPPRTVDDSPAEPPRPSSSSAESDEEAFMQGADKLAGERQEKS